MNELINFVINGDAWFSWDCGDLMLSEHKSGEIFQIKWNQMAKVKLSYF